MQSEKYYGLTDTQWLSIIFLLVYVLPLGMRPLGIPDEMRYAEIPREMLQSGNWLVPTLNGLFYFEKPVLGYWLNAISIFIFGENAFAVRLPGVLVTGLTALLIFQFAKRVATHQTALLAVCIHLSLLEVFFVGTYNVLDNLLAYTLTGVFVYFYFSHIAKEKRTRIKNLIQMGFYAGLAFLTKGFLAFALPVIVVVLFLFLQKRWMDLLSRAWIPILIAAIVIAPWAILVHIKAPDYWHYFFWIEHVKRFSAEDAQHISPFWTYFAAFPLVAFPWSIYIPTAAKGILHQYKSQSSELTRAITYLLVWFVLPFLFFSVAKGKLLTYLLPLLPAFSMLIAIGCSNRIKNGTVKNWQPGYFGIIVLILGLIALIVGQFLSHELNPFYGNEIWKFFLFSLALLIGSYFFWKDTQSKQSGYWTALTMLPLYLIWATYFATPQQITDRKAPGPFLASQKERITTDTILISDDTMMHAVTWTFKRTNVYMMVEGEVAYGLSYEKDRHRNLSKSNLLAFITENQNKKIAIFYRGKIKQLASIRQSIEQNNYDTASKGVFNVLYINREK